MSQPYGGRPAPSVPRNRHAGRRSGPADRRRGPPARRGGSGHRPARGDPATRAGARPRRRSHRVYVRRRVAALLLAVVLIFLLLLAADEIIRAVRSSPRHPTVGSAARVVDDSQAVASSRAVA